MDINLKQLMTSSHFKYLEFCFVLVSLTFFLGSPLKLLVLAQSSQSFQAGTNILEQLVFLLIHFISFGLILIKRKIIFSELIKCDKLIILSITVLLMVIMLSALWSEYPDLTIRRGIALWGTTLFGVYFSACHSYEKQFQFLTQTFALVAILSFVVAIILPTYGVMSETHAGAWRGIFLHKNGLGSAMVLGVLIFLMQCFDQVSNRRINLLLLGLSMFLLLASTSKNALVIVVVLIALFPILSFLRLRVDIMVPVILGSIFLITLTTLGIIENLGALFSLLGKDPTLTGRTDIWPYVWEAAEKKIWLGYGYQGFWQGFDSEAARIWYTVGWEPTHPHNGLLELLLIFGFLFTSLFVLVFTWLFLRSIALAKSSTSKKYFLPIIFLTYTFISNLGETKVFEYNDLSWVLFIVVAFVVAKPLSVHTLQTSY